VCRKKMRIAGLYFIFYFTSPIVYKHRQKNNKKVRFLCCCCCCLPTSLLFFFLFLVIFIYLDFFVFLVPLFFVTLEGGISFSFLPSLDVSRFPSFILFFFLCFVRMSAVCSR
jgi:hypothetical protein